MSGFWSIHPAMQQPPLEQKPTSRKNTPRPARFMQTASMAALLACGGTVAGCQHRDAIDATLDLSLIHI
nr:hypothetical protein [Acetobacter syzygii]